MIFFILSKFSILTAAGCVANYNMLTDLYFYLHHHFKTPILSKVQNTICYINM